MAYARTTVAELRDTIKERLGGEGIFWTAEEINNALNEALAVWQLLTGDFVLTYNQSCAAGSQVVTFSGTTPAMQFLRARRFSGTGTATALAGVLHPAAISELDFGFYGRQGTASTSTPEWWAPCGIDKFILFPPPNSTQTIQMQYYSADPRVALDGTTYLDLGDEEVLCLVNYAVWACSFKEGLQEALNNTAPLREMFLTAARLRNSKLTATAAYRAYMGNDRDTTKPTTTAPEKQGLRG